MDPIEMNSMEERGGALSEILPYQRWLAWRPVDGALGSVATVGESYGESPGSGDACLGGSEEDPVVGPIAAAQPALGVSSSGRMATTLEFRAERSDDGLLVGPEGPQSGGRRIVWVADLSLVPLSLDRLASDPSGTRFLAPTVAVGTGTNVSVQWPGLPTGEYALRFTVLCRPDDDVTFENEGFNSSVSVSAQGGCTRVSIQPYPTLPPVEIEVHATAELRVDPVWQRGVDVIGWDGTEHVEDRFSPGELRFRWSNPGAPLAVSARVLSAPGAEDGQPPRAVAPGNSSPSARYLDADWLGAAEARGISVAESDASGGSVSSSPSSSDGDGDGDGDGLGRDGPMLPGFGPGGSAGRLASLLWRTRALALSVEGGRTQDRDALENVMGECVELAFSRARGGAVWQSISGLPRWDEPAGSECRDRLSPAVEHAALLHAVLVAAAHDAADSGERRRLEQEATRLSQWFQDSFWLSTPQRLADRALPRHRRTIGGEGLLGLMALRPHMVVASSLVGAPMTLSQRRHVLRAAEVRLLTPMGLRTLDFEAEAFDARQSNAGLIFPWLLAPYVRASVLAFGLGRTQSVQARTLLRGFEAAPEAWFLEPGAPIHAARAVGAIGLFLHGVELRALDRLLGVESATRSARSRPTAGHAALHRRTVPGSQGADGEWVLR